MKMAYIESPVLDTVVEDYYFEPNTEEMREDLKKQLYWNFGIEFVDVTSPELDIGCVAYDGYNDNKSKVILKIFLSRLGY